MLELLKKYGIPAGVASVIVLALTVVPLYFQYQTAAKQTSRIEALERHCVLHQK